MRKLKALFHFSSEEHGITINEEVAIEIPDNSTKKEVVDKKYREWMNSKFYYCWEEIEYIENKNSSQ